jgi:hypothetical protein
VIFGFVLHFHVSFTFLCPSQRLGFGLEMVTLACLWLIISSIALAQQGFEALVFTEVLLLVWTGPIITL